MSVIGIDFGTTNSVLAQFVGGRAEVVPIDQPPATWGGEFANVLPSVFALDSNRTPLFGWAAKQQPERSDAIKRLLKTDEEFVEVAGERFFIEEIAALLFGHLKQSTLNVGIGFSQAVVTVPANSRGLARYRTKLAAGLSGIEVTALMNEPTAAAMAFGIHADDDQKILVVDWGGGTLDVTVLKVVGGIFMEEASKGIQSLGGLDFDRMIYRNLTADIPGADQWDRPTTRLVETEVERAKIALSTADEISVALPGGERRLLTRKRMNDWCAPLIDQVAGPIARCLEDVKMTATGFDHLLLVGGTCMMPAVRDRIAELTNREPSRGVSPMTAVAEGAAVAAAVLAGEVDSEMFVATEHALGTTIVGPGGNGLVFSEIIPRNHKLPARESNVYVPVNDFQEAIDLMIVEGDPTKPLDDDDNVLLRNWEIAIPPRPLGDSRFEVTYEYDTNGIVHVQVDDLSSGERLFSGDLSFSAGPAPTQRVAMAQNVETILGAATSAARNPARPPEVSEMLNRARNLVIPFIPDAEAAAIRELAERLEQTCDEGGDYGGLTEELATALRKYSYLY